jgi:iron complex outermembrane receptor protein
MPAQEPEPARPVFADLDIEELARIRITSASRRPEPVSRAATAIFVITREDIRRAGVSSLPEALRLAPGLQVGRVSARDWSITSRGFAEQSPNKLLVLVDGRAVYSPLFAGVFWDVQDVMLEDVDRIEVILGSGATLWGSNAVNGVINVITRDAAATPGGLVAARPGTARSGAAARYGVSLGDSAAVRVYGKFTDRDPARLTSGAESEDDWQQGQGGFRLDLAGTPRDRLTLQGDLYAGSGGLTVQRPVLGPPFAEVVRDQLDAHGGHLLGRWTRRLGETAELQVQAYYDRAVRKVPSSFGTVAVDILNLQFQHHFALAPRHDFVWGAEYRLSVDTISGTFPITLDPGRRTTHLITAFAQDEIELAARRWYLSLGTKLERNSYSGFELQPNVRLLWLPADRHTIWSAVSRAVRIPSRLDTDLSFIAQVLPTSPTAVVRFEGNEDFDSEELVAWELGYRTRLGSTLSADLSLYFSWYDRLRSVTPLAPVMDGGLVVQPFRVDNALRGEAYGGTVSVNWYPVRTLRFRTSYTLLEMDVSPRDDAPPGTIPNVNPGFNPSHQAAVRSSFTLPRGIELELGARYVGELPEPPIADYLEADARLGWMVRPDLTLAVVGRDLLASRHAEFSSVPQREIQRRGELHLEWRF